MHKEAALDFIAAGEPKKAAKQYANIPEHDKVLALLCAAGLYKELVTYLRESVSFISRKT